MARVGMRTRLFPQKIPLDETLNFRARLDAVFSRSAESATRVFQDGGILDTAIPGRTGFLGSSICATALPSGIPRKVFQDSIVLSQPQDGLVAWAPRKEVNEIAQVA